MKQILFVMILALFSCTKQYIENPTCFKFMELSDKFTGEMVPIRVDTLWTSGVPGVLSYACGADVNKLEQANRDAHPEGCESGFQIIHYKIFY